MALINGLVLQIACVMNNSFISKTTLDSSVPKGLVALIAMDFLRLQFVHAMYIWNRAVVRHLWQ